MNTLSPPDDAFHRAAKARLQEIQDLAHALCFETVPSLQTRRKAAAALLQLSGQDRMVLPDDDLVTKVALRIGSAVSHFNPDA
jgi:hypothetical protein